MLNERKGEREIKGMATLMVLYGMIRTTTPNSRVCLIWTVILCRAGVQEEE